VIIVFLRICFLLPIFIASFLSIIPASAANETFCNNVNWDVERGKLISSWPEENIYLYAMDWKRAEEEHSGVYREIELYVKGFGRYFPCWQVDTNPVWRPTFDMCDLDNDGKKELIVISTSGTGTGVLLQEVRVFRFDTAKPNRGLEDIYVMDPWEGIYQNVKAKMIKNDGTVTIRINVKGKDYTMTAKESDLVSWGDEVGYGSIRRYIIVNNKLTAEMSVVVGNGVSIATIAMDYIFENNRLRVNNVTFKQYNSSWPIWTD
jgi:hypothetical protein